MAFDVADRSLLHRLCTLLFDDAEKNISKLERVQGNLERLVTDIGVRRLHDAGRCTDKLSY